MYKYTENNLINYSKALSETEDKKCSRTISKIKTVLNKFKLIECDNSTIIDETWKSYNGYVGKYTNNILNITLLLQGSYANKTCVRMESDVDIALIIENPFHVLYCEGKKDEDYGFTPNKDFNFLKFKNDLVTFLKDEFGYENIERHNKSIKIKGNDYWKDADVVPCYRYKNYYSIDSINPNEYIGGISIPVDNSNTSIVNFPEQHIENGKIKNVQTKRRFKRIVRIMKRINNDLQEEGLYKNKISSFGIECCVYNVPNSYFLKHETYTEIIKDVLMYLNNLENYSLFVEVNDIFYLFKHDCNKNINEYYNFFRELGNRI